jgi:hypothetical protein
VSEPLPPGKYERRSGHPAWVIGKTPDGKGLVVCHSAAANSWIHYPDGKWSQCGERPHDLIAPWKEPRKVSGPVYVSLVEYDGSSLCLRASADPKYPWQGKIIAERVIEVPDLTEGEGS